MADKPPATDFTEPSDIVERLESALSHFVATEAEGMTSYTSEMLREAAAEITRLREALAAEREECARVADECHRQDEIDNGAAATGAAGTAAAAIRAMES